MRRKGFLYLCFFSCACAMVWSCGKDEGLEVKESELWGQWVKEGTQYYWTFESDGTGNLVNRGEFEEGDENNGDFTWTINGGDELEVEFKGSGELGGIDIVKLYTIKEISSTMVRWEDVYGRSTKLIRL